MFRLLPRHVYVCQVPMRSPLLYSHRDDICSRSNRHGELSSDSLKVVCQVVQIPSFLPLIYCPSATL